MQRERESREGMPASQPLWALDLPVPGPQLPAKTLTALLAAKEAGCTGAQEAAVPTLQPLPPGVR